ncbi:MAG: hypothetical protein ACYC9U_12000 [Nitrososphaerales archaeon]
MTLYCPFCGAREDARVEGQDEVGEKVLLVMFDCPFYFRFYARDIGADNGMQVKLTNWRKENGDQWLDSVGEDMKNRELRNIEQGRIPE